MIYDGKILGDGASCDVFMIEQGDGSLGKYHVLQTVVEPKMTMWVEEIHGVTRVDRTNNPSLFFISAKVNHGLGGTDDRDMEMGEKVIVIGIGTPDNGTMPLTPSMRLRSESV